MELEANRGASAVTVIHREECAWLPPPSDVVDAGPCPMQWFARRDRPKRKQAQVVAQHDRGTGSLDEDDPVMLRGVRAKQGMHACRLLTVRAKERQHGCLA